MRSQEFLNRKSVCFSVSLNLGAWVLEFPLAFPRPFLIQILLQIFGCDMALNSIGRHFSFGRPGNRVEHELPDFVVAPVLMVMASGKPEAAAAIRTFASPGYGLWLTALYSFAHRRVTFMRPIWPLCGA